MLSDDNVHTIIRKYFQKNNVLTDHQISSYNDLIDNIIPNILNQLFPIVVPIENEILNRIKITIINLKTVSPYYTENNGCTYPMTLYC